MRRPRPQSAMSAQRRIREVLKRLKCANSGHSATAWRTGEIDPEQSLPAVQNSRILLARIRTEISRLLRDTPKRGRAPSKSGF